MKRTLLAFARSRAGSGLLRLLLHRLPARLPAAVLLRTPTISAFRHPVPAYREHVLLVPLPPVEDLEGLSGGADFVGVVQAAGRLADRLKLPPGWRLVVNTGRFQEVRVLHFHLILD